MMASLRSLSIISGRRKRGWLFVLATLILSGSMITACSGLFSSSQPAATATATGTALTQLHWCGKPLMLFRDEGAPSSPSASTTATTAAGTATATTTATVTATATATSQVTATATGPRTLTDWAEVEPLLGFTVYLPPRLPNRTCLVSALGTVHDPIFGGNFSISYLLPDGNSISLSEAPLRTQKPLFQCTSSLLTATAGTKSAPATGTATPRSRVTATATPNQICSGVHGTTSIVFSAPGDQQALQKFFNSLQPNVAWVPVS
jgi:hypothetical protein